MCESPSGAPILRIPKFSFVPVLVAIPLQHSEGASYFALPTLDRRLLRLSRHLYPTTMAAPGASYDAAMAFPCGVIGELEKGCFADVVLPGCNEARQVRRYMTVSVCTPIITFAERYHYSCRRYWTNCMGGCY